MPRQALSLAVIVVLVLVAVGCSSPAPATQAPAAPKQAAAAPTQAPASSASISPTAAPKAVATAAPASPTAAAKTAPSSAGAPKKGGELRMLLESDAPAGYDPPIYTSRSQWIIGATVFDTLTEVQPDGKITPGLAQSWDVSSDGLTYTFKLQPGVKFHNGREMNATDVKYSIERIMDPATKSARIGNFRAVDQITAPDPATVVIKLKQPFAPLLVTLAHTTASIVPREEVEKGNFTQKPVGTGPFKFTEWVRDERVVVEANPNYWRSGRPYLDRIRFTFNVDVNARAAALRSGSVDFLYNVPGETVPLMQNQNNIMLYGGQGSMTFQHMWFNTKKEPFNDIRLRQAVLAAFDYKAIADAVEPNNSAVLDCGFLPKSHWAPCNDTVWAKPDLDRAKKLLAEAGKPNGFEVRFMAGSSANMNRLAAVVTEQLRPLGIKVNVQMLEGANTLTAASRGEFDLFGNQFSATFDPDERISQAFVTGGGINYAGYSNPRVDELAKQGQQAGSQTERARIYAELQKIVTEEAPIAFLFTLYVRDGSANYVKGYTWNPFFDYRSLREVWLDK